MMPSILLMGMKHTGKTTLGKKLAETLRRQFYDLDDIIVSIYRENVPAAVDATCRTIYATHGREYFQALEGAGAARLSTCIRKGPAITAALGGGIISNPDALETLRNAGCKVVLTAQPEELFKRIARRGIPPFLEGPDPYRRFLELFKQRTEGYASIADYVVDCTGLGLKESFSLLITTLKGEGIAR